jgi:hypothetical protein
MRFRNYKFEISVDDLTSFWFNFSKWNTSDVNEHIAVMHKYADECEHITEFGVRTGVSTWAWLASRAKTIRCYDIENVINNLEHHIQSSKDTRKDFTFKQADTIADGFEIEPTDLLFIDTDHTYKQCSKELQMHGNKARKYIIFHDTIICGHELIRAIDEFLENNKNWKRKEVFSNNNGLTILERIQ